MASQIGRGRYKVAEKVAYCDYCRSSANMVCTV